MPSTRGNVGFGRIRADDEAAFLLWPQPAVPPTTHNESALDARGDRPARFAARERGRNALQRRPPDSAAVRDRRLLRLPAQPDRANLVLAATIGLRQESVGRIRMRLSEGLAGLVAEQPRAAVRRRRGDASPVQVLPRRRRGSLSIVSWRAGHGSRAAPGRAGRPDDRAARRSATTDVRMLQTAGTQLAPIVSEARTLGQFVAPGHQRLKALSREPVVELGRGHDGALPRARSGGVARDRPQPRRPARPDADRAPRGARVAARPAQPHQQRLPADAGVSGLAPHVGRRGTPASSARGRSRTSPPNSACTSRCRSTRAASASWPAITSRRRPISACRWSASGCTTTRVISGSGSITPAGSTRTTWISSTACSRFGRRKSAAGR